MNQRAIMTDEEKLLGITYGLIAAYTGYVIMFGNGIDTAAVINAYGSQMIDLLKAITPALFAFLGTVVGLYFTYQIKKMELKDKKEEREENRNDNTK